jgi:hypothetical protein
MMTRYLLLNERGSAAAEMALVTPLLLGLMLGSIELGRYFHNQHVALTAVRDGARFAARQELAQFVSADGCRSAPSSAVEANTRKIVRFGKLNGTTPRLPYWNSDTTITLSLACFSTTGPIGSVQPVAGIYSGITTTTGATIGAPVVTVTALVPYTPLFGLLGRGLRLNAQQQAVVSGV